MVVDETNLDFVIEALKSKQTLREEQLKNISHVLSTLEKIQLGENGVLPIDKDVSQTITQQRRDEIYDNCIGVANELLNTHTTN